MMEQTKTATRDYPAFSRTPWSLWETLYARRSHRKFLPGEVDASLANRLQELVGLAVSARGAAAGTLTAATGREEVERIKRRLHKGVQGKINLWLNEAPVAGFLALAVPLEDARSERPRLLPLAAMAAEDAVLWLTEAGLGTCWMGGINQKEVREALGLGPEAFIPAVIPYGRPKQRVKAMDIDHVMYRRISRKRKPLTGIAYVETIERPYALPELQPQAFSAASVQDVAGLLRRLQEGGESSADTPLDLAVEACLEAARIAPSAGNSQRWHFVAVTGADALGRLADACGSEGSWRRALVGVGDTAMGFLYEKMEKPFWMIDLPIAFSQMSLMASSMDLAVEVCVADIDEGAVNAAVGVQPPLRSVGVMGIK